QYNETPQALRISPGVFSEILSPDQPINYVDQHLFDKKLVTNHALDFTKKFGNYSFSFQPGVDFKLQHMDSQILLDGNPHTDRDFENDMKWQEVSTYVRTGINYQTDKARISLQLPFDVTHYEIEDQILNEKQSKNPFTLNPSLWGQ